MSITLPVLNQKYSCHSCGHCCRKYTVPVTPEEKARIEAQRWGDDEALAGTEVFRWSDLLGGYTLAQRDDGACVFLDENNRCRIHSKFGEHTKPLGCRMYPFVFNRVGNSTYVSLRFDCPSVAGNRGRDLDEQKAELKQLAREVVASREETPLRFRDEQTLPAGHLVASAQAFEWLVADASLDFTRRALACANLAELLRAVDVQRVERLEQMREFLHLASDVVVADAQAMELERKPPDRLVALTFRQLLALYAQRESSSRWKLIVGSLLGRGRVPRWQPDMPQVKFAQLEESFGRPDVPATELLARNLRSKVGGMGFFGPAFHGFSLLEGLDSLLLAIPVTLWFARLFAAGQGAQSLGAEAVARALHLVEKPWGRRAVFRLAAERQRAATLARPEHLKPLLIWYGS